MKTETRNRVFIINPDEAGQLIETRPGTPNDEILQERQERLDKMGDKPKVGDFIFMQDKGDKMHRFCHDHGEQGLQTTAGGRFYLGHRGCDYSGGLDPSVPLYRIKKTSFRTRGKVWFFDRDEWGAGRGIDAVAMFNVFRELSDSELTPERWKQRSKQATSRMKQAFKFWGDNYKMSANY